MTTGAAAPPLSATITVVLIDDHFLLADSVAATLGADERMEVLAIAGTCADGLREVSRLRPDVCLLDQRLPDGLGTDLVSDLHAASPTTKVLLMTGNTSTDVVRQAMAAGSVGVVSKGERAAALHDAVVRAAAGGTVLSAHDIRRLLPQAAQARRRPGDDLTPRELDILRLLVAGVPTAEIAKQLTISHATARNHIQAVINKLGAHTKLEAVAIALRADIVSGP